MHSSSSTQSANKLIVRSEVLAVIRQLTSTSSLSRSDMAKQLKRLHELGAPDYVQDVLVKELSTCQSLETLPILVDCLMALGHLDYLHDKLWTVIRETSAMDEVKDAANLILRHLGDKTEPDAYLRYLKDPEGLIDRETVRMLEVSAENPEAMIDFLDFVASLDRPRQIMLLESLHNDYPVSYLVNLYVALLESDPAPDLWTFLVEGLGETRSHQAAYVLHRLSLWPEDRLPIPVKVIHRSLKQLQLAGVYRPEQLLDMPPPASHPIVDYSTPYQCFVTLSDGMGNQGILLSRQRLNGDMIMISMAVNDQHGILDCFGFFQISANDFHRLCDKFHEGVTKIKVSAEYGAAKIRAAEALNLSQRVRLPYEYRCWSPILADIQGNPTESATLSPDWIRSDWAASSTATLYQQPDFASWFMERGDLPEATRLLQQAALLVEEALTGEQAPDTLLLPLEELSHQLIHVLWVTPWRSLMVQRLTEAACLLDNQQLATFRDLAATEAHRLSDAHMSAPDISGFMLAYARRCIVEDLLRLRTAHPQADAMTCVIDTLCATWEV
jgi:hypothetical protein